MLSSSFESLSQSLRILSEAVLRSHDLIMVDPHEASGNIEQGFTNLLNAFHSLYDKIKLDTSIDFDWYGIAETATILAIRNARHHNTANRIQGLYAFQLEKPNPTDFIKYIVIDYPETEDGGSTFQTLISWGDMSDMLALPNNITKLRPSAIELIRDYLASDLMNTYAGKYNVPAPHVFFNATPLIVNALIILIPIIKGQVKPRSTEAKLFLSHFDNVLPTNTKKHEIFPITVFLPG
jgi:hypothetical protein